MPSEVNQFLREACPANNGVVGKFRCHGTSAIYPALSRRITCRTDNTVEAPLVFWFIPALATPKKITPSDCNLCVILQPTTTHTHEPNLESELLKCRRILPPGKAANGNPHHQQIARLPIYSESNNESICLEFHPCLQ
jgi:hypothetical protein